MYLIRITALVVGIALGAAPSREQETTVELQTSAEQLLWGDPLYLKVTVRNGTDRPVRLARDLDTGGLAFQVRPKGEGEPTGRLPLEWMGYLGELPRPIPPGGRSSHVRPLFHSVRGFAFPSPGEYEVRAWVAVAGNPPTSSSEPVSSAWVPVSVRKRQARETELVQGAVLELVHAIPSSSGVHVNSLEALQAIEESLSPSALKSALAVSQDLLRLHMGVKQGAQARESLARRRALLDPVSCEALDMALAHEHSLDLDWRGVAEVYSWAKRDPGPYWDLIGSKVESYSRRAE
jgi:hypothetical protein